MVCAALSMMAAPALAKKKHRKLQSHFGPVSTVTAVGNTTAAAGDVSTATATCPSGTEAVGGGFSAPFTMSSAPAVNSSYRSSPQSWRVEAQIYFSAGAATAFAYCRSVPRPVTDVTTTTNLGPYPTTTAVSASCPAGSQLIGGGIQTATGTGPNNFGTPIVNMSKAAGTWTAAAVNNGSIPVPLTAHVYCVQGIRQPTTVESNRSGGVDPYGTVSATTGSCPVPPKAKKGKKGKNGKRKKRRQQPAQLLSAGGFSSASGSSPSNLPIFSESQISGTGWLATVANSSSGTVLQVTSQGICVG
jgi:hypothetical protein